MVSLAELWMACGVKPAAVVGHSQGEIAAAHVAGALSLEDAARLVAIRSRILSELEGHGAMLAIALRAEDLALRLEQWEEGRLVIAAVNGPASVVVSGEPQALGELRSQCAEEEIRVREIVGAVGAGHSPQLDVLRERLLEVFATLAPRSGEIPFYSTVTAGLVDTAELDSDYWYRNARQRVQFDPAVRTLLGDGHRIFIEVSAHPAFTGAVGGIAEDALPDPGEVLAVSSLRRGDGSRERFLLSLAEAFVGGVEVDWRAVSAERSARLVKLPSYAFQRRRYWLDPSLGRGDLGSSGLIAAEHPFLSVSVRLAGDRGWMLTGRLSLETHPWLADHAAMGVVILPGTAFVELALHAGETVGTALLSELVLESPLALEEQQAVQLQVCVGEPDDTGARSIGIYSRPETAAGDSQSELDWTCHANGTLAGETGSALEDGGASSLGADAWPAPEAQAIDLEHFYERGSEIGVDFGPAFNGLRAAWRSGDRVFAEVALPEELASQAGSFGVHPALLDAALHTIGLFGEGEADRNGATAPTLRLPFSWSGVRLHQRGASSLRVRLQREAEDRVSLVVADAAGEPVAAVESLVLREFTQAQLHAARRSRGDSLFCVEWKAQPLGSVASTQASWTVLGREGTGIATGAPAGVSVEVLADMKSLVQRLDAGDPPPQLVVLDCAHYRTGAGGHPAQETELADGGIEGTIDAAHEHTKDVLEVLQHWLAEERLSDSHLVVVTRDAVAVEGQAPVSGLAQAPIWGLVRSAQSESPGCFALVDLDGGESSPEAIAGALAGVEPQLALRAGELLAPALARVPPRASAPGESSAEHAWDLDPSGSVLITGGTGDLGGLLAKHLVARHGAGRLILASRRGPEAPGVEDLVAELGEIGALVTVVACDVADREQLSALIDAVPEQHPLVAVVHGAAALEDGVIASIEPAQLDRVLAPKLDAAWHLHQLTEHLELSAFVLLSSVMGILGGPGQANYAAANTFLDALAAHRRARGLPGASMAWGGWLAANVAARMDQAGVSRTGRLGVGVLSPQEGLDLFDLAGATDRALTVPMRLETATLRAQARDGLIPPMLRKLIRVPAPSAGDAAKSLLRRLADTAADEREDVVLAVVRAEVAIVLGYPSPEAIEPKSSFKQLGLDSLGAVELRNRLNLASGLRLPSTLVFDHPTPASVAALLLAQLFTQEDSGDPQELEVRRALASVPLERMRELGLLEPLLRLADAAGAADAAAPDEQGSSIDEMDLGQLVEKAMNRPGGAIAPEGVR